jgi:hypothetical protein
METPSPLLEALTREGVLLGVTVRYWRATKKLNAEDLGLDPEKVTQRLISLGHKKLLPKEALESLALIESRAHALVEAGTFPFLKGLARYLPNAKLPEVLARLRALETEFQTATRRFLEHYAETRDQALAEWTKAAEQLVPEPARLVAAIAAAFPEPARMQRSFEFSLQLYQVKAPEGLDLELVQAGQQEEILRARQQAATEAALQIHRQAETFVGDCVASLRQQTAQLCEEMLESMRTGKSGVHQKTLNRLTRFVEQFKQLNFAGDTQMEAELERVRQEFLQRTAEQYRDDAFARERLAEGLRNLAATAQGLAQQEDRELVERFGVMGQRRFHLQAA